MSVRRQDQTPRGVARIRDPFDWEVLPCGYVVWSYLCLYFGIDGKCIFWEFFFFCREINKWGKGEGRKGERS